MARELGSRAPSDRNISKSALYRQRGISECAKRIFDFLAFALISLLIFETGLLAAMTYVQLSVPSGLVAESRRMSASWLFALLAKSLDTAQMKGPKSFSR